VASYNYLLRMPILSRFLHIIDAETEQKFSTLVDEIAKNHFSKVKLLSPAENMEKRSKMERNRLSPEAFPVHDEKTQSAFYGAHVTAASQPILHPSLLYEGRLVRRSVLHPSPKTQGKPVRRSKQNDTHKKQTI
jgi:hypothetical protein